MIRNSRRVVALAIAGALVIAPAVSGCGAGRSPETALPTQLTEGVNAETKTGVAVRNIFVLGPAPGQKLAPGAAAPVYGVIVNNGKQSDRLVSVSSSAFQQGATPAGGGIDLPVSQVVSLNTESGSASAAVSLAPPSAAPKSTPGAKASGGPVVSGQVPAGPPVVLSGLKQQFFGGETIDLVLQFQQAGALTLKVPVVPQDAAYATYSPAPSAGPATPAAAGASPATGGQAQKKGKKSPTPAASPTP